MIMGMNEVMKEMMGPEVYEMFGIPDDAEKTMYVATVPDKNSGAGVIAYQDFMDQAAERVGGDFFVLHIRTKICGVEKDNQVIYQIFDEDGKEVASAARPADSPDTSIPLYKPHRWDIKNSYQYTLKALIMRNNECLDEVELKFGVRTFCCDPGRGFLINGNCVPLRGVSRHQDKLYQGNALTKEDHVRDAELIEEIGANTVRLAHYQHAQEFYNECDKRGFVVWAEIPFISVMNEDPLAHENCITQLKELIYQNDHHPSICFWGISNEILIGGISEKLVENHRELNALAKKIDPYRLTTIAHVTMTPKDGPMHEITDVESYNHYFGWYGGKTEDNGPWMDEYHEKYPNRCIGLSEYGFDNYSYLPIMSPLYPVDQVKINNSAGAEAVAVAPEDEIKVLLPNDYDPDKMVTDIQLNSESVDAPVREGDVLGSVTVSYAGEILGQTKLLALPDVARSGFSCAAAGAEAYIQKNWWKWVVIAIFAAIGVILVLIVLYQLRKRRYRRKRMEQRRRALENQRRRFREGYDLPVDELEQR